LNLFELAVKIGVDDSGFNQGIGKAKRGFGDFSAWTIAKGQLIADAVKSSGKALIDFGKQAIKSYSEYEQLAGGAQKIFDQMDFSKISEDAQNAYKELGLSANQYLAVMNDVGATFAATMGDEAGYEAAKTGLKAISDYASGTGKNVDELSSKFTLITRSTSSYQSIADQFSGILPATSKGFLEQAQAAGILSDKYTELTQVPIDEYQAAVSKMLERGVSDLGLAGNTAAEAMTTISGSLAMTKASWSNLITGIASGNADVKKLTQDFSKSIGAVAKNILPVIKDTLSGISDMIGEVGPIIVEELPGLVGEVLPPLIQSATSLIQSLAQALPELLPILIDAIIMATPAIITGIVTAFQSIVAILPDLIQQISDALPVLVPQIVVGLGLMAVSLAQQLPEIFLSVVDAMVNLFAGAWDGIKQVFSLNAVKQFFSNVWESAKSAFGSVANWFGNIFSDAWQAVKNVFSTGGRIFDGIKDGIVNAFKTIVNGIIGGINKVIAVPFNAINGVLRKIKNVSIVGIKPFDWIQTFSVPQIPKLWRGGVLERGQIGLLEGSGAEAVVPLENNKKWISKVADDMRKSVGGFGGNVYNIEINVDGARYKDEQSLAVAIAQEIQNLTDRRSAVYA
jgi:phage-related protein